MITENGFQFDIEHPFRRFNKLFGGGTERAAPPKPVDPVPTPTEVDEGVKQKDRDKRRQKIAQAGRGGTILTQGQPLTGGGNATLLGRSTS